MGKAIKLKDIIILFESNC